MMLAFYLAAPEVENDRRSINVFNGMRTAKKEGRWISSAPLGYGNFTGSDGRKYIAPVEPAASAMKWIFQELVKGHYICPECSKTLSGSASKGRSAYITTIATRDVQ